MVALKGKPDIGDRINKEIVALMDRHLPNWRFFKAQLNRLPVRHEDWLY